MSELDIELQKQTQGVSVTEMIQEANTMGIALNGKEVDTGEIPIGDDKDGK